MKIQKYQVLEDRVLKGETYVKAGDYVYDNIGHDYGLANADSRAFHDEHISVTLNPEGKEPFFTIPVRHLKQVD